MIFNEYSNCNLCPRKCGADRNNENTGFCKCTAVPKVGRAALHHWEEPCVSGENGSGTVFFSGCTLGCCYCQNYALSKELCGKFKDEQELCDIFIKLQNQGAHNINLVTAEHFAPHIRQAVLLAKNKNLSIPVILNSSGYVSEDTLKILSDVIDIYLVDFKYMDNSLAKKYSLAQDYPDIAKKALQKMVELQPNLVYDNDRILKKGVIVRHLCLPTHTKDSKHIINYVFNTYGNNIKLSIMSQYTPVIKNSEYEHLNRTLSEEEYDEVIDYCIKIGIEDAYIQEGEAASESFIPSFE